MTEEILQKITTFLNKCDIHFSIQNNIIEHEEILNEMNLNQLKYICFGYCYFTDNNQIISLE